MTNVYDERRKRAERIERGKPSRITMQQNWDPKDLRWCQYCDEIRGEGAMRWVGDQYICTVCKPRPSNCRPGMMCWQGCPNCRPEPTYTSVLSPNEVRRLKSHVTREGVHMVDLWPEEEIIAWQGCDAVEGYTDIRGDAIHVYRQSYGDRACFGEYRNGLFTRSWVA